MRTAKVANVNAAQRAAKERMERGLVLWKSGLSYEEVGRRVGVSAATVRVWVERDPEVLESRIAEARRLSSMDANGVDAREQYLDIAGRTAEFARLLREFQIRNNCVPKVPPVKEREG
jgi:hypothetical protein